MSLKEFHVVFISASILLLIGFAGWGFQNARPLWAVLSAVAAALLGLYEIYFVRKTKASHDR